MHLTNACTSYTESNICYQKRYREEAVRVLVKTIGGVWLSGNVYDVIYQANGIAVDHVHYFITPIAFTVEVHQIFIFDFLIS